MRDEKKWQLAQARFESFRKHIPHSIGVERVREYHDVLELLQAAVNEDLSIFHIPDSEMRPVVTGIPLMATYRNPRPKVTYSDKVFCDNGYFRRQIDGLAAYLLSIEDRQTEPRTGNDYWSMSDGELETLASRFHIEGYGFATGHIDRNIIISALLRRDKAIRAGNPPPPNQTIHVETMTGSVIQQGTSGSNATVNFQIADVKGIVEQIKAAIDELPLNKSAKDELDAEVRTIEPQFSSPNPKRIVIVQCLSSMRAILEGVAGSLIATGIVHEITKLIGN
jgi:hypothetical protein